MKTKDELIEKLRSDPLYLSALRMAGDDKDRVMRLVEGFVSQLSPVIISAIESAKNDPTFVNHLRRNLSTSSTLVNPGDSTIVSGSAG